MSSLPWSCGSWIYNYLCNQCLSTLKLWVRIPFMVRCTRQHYVIKFVRDLRQVGGFLRVLRFPPPTNKTDPHDITEILLNMALTTTNQTTICYIDNNIKNYCNNSISFQNVSHHKMTSNFFLNRQQFNFCCCKNGFPSCVRIVHILHECIRLIVSNIKPKPHYAIKT